MLRYLGLGKRRFGEHPMPAHPRLNWEFLAVVRGKIAPFEKSAEDGEPVSDRFWLFPPGVVHGWVGKRGQTCELIVVHYSSVPPAVEQIAARHGHLETPLSAADHARLREIAKNLKRHYWQPTVETDLQAQRALMDMCLLALRDYPERGRRQITGGSYSRVVAAEDWLLSHLHENPSVHGAAQSVGLSDSQLYRLFTQIRKESPQQVLNRMKIERAMELLGQSNAKLQKVAAECGFSNASNFCRTFKAVKGRSPTTWRRETFIQYKVPGKTVHADHTKHGRRLRPAL